MVDMPPPTREPGQSNWLSQKSAGLPRWGWVVIAGALGFVGIWWWSHHNSTTPDTSTTDTGTTDPSQLPTSEYEMLLANIRDLQGRASIPGPPGPAGAPGAPGAPAAPAGGGGVVIDRPPLPTGTALPPRIITQQPTKAPIPARKFLTVVPYTTSNTSRLSTLSGMVDELKRMGVTSSVAKLKTLNPTIGANNVIHPGQHIYYT